MDNNTPKYNINNKETRNSDFKNEVKFNEDDAMEIISIEFQELQDWIKEEIKILKQDSYDIVECLKVNKSKLNMDDYE